MSNQIETVAKAIADEIMRCAGIALHPDTARDAASAALAAQQDGAWRPIETAPKDGTKVLLVEDDQPSEVCTGWWMMDAWRDYGDIGCNGQEDYAPTHWMPLPFGPSALEQTPMESR